MRIRHRNASGQIIQPENFDARMQCHDGLIEAKIRALTNKEIERSDNYQSEDKVIRLLALPFKDRYDPPGANWSESFSPDAFDDYLRQVESGDANIQLISGHWSNPLNSLLAGTQAQGEGSARAWVEKDGPEPGLYMEAHLMSDDPLSSRAYKLVEAGLIGGASISFREHDVKVNRSETVPHYHVMRADVSEISLVDLPAYEMTDVSVVQPRSEPQPEPEREGDDLREMIEDLKERNRALEAAMAELSAQKSQQQDNGGKSLDELLLTIHQ